MVALVLFGGIGALLGLLVGLPAPRLPVVAGFGFTFAAGYLLLAYLAAPEATEGAGNEATEWHGRYAEWFLVLFVTATNLLAFLVVSFRVVALRRRRAT